MMRLTATPTAASTSWTVALPVDRPITLHRSLDGGSTFVPVAVLSEAHTADTFVDAEVPATAYPLYDYTTGE